MADETRAHADPEAVDMEYATMESGSNGTLDHPPAAKGPWYKRKQVMVPLLVASLLAVAIGVGVGVGVGVSQANADSGSGAPAVTGSNDPVTPQGEGGGSNITPGGGSGSREGGNLQLGTSPPAKSPPPGKLKSKWPELLGTLASAAPAVIQKDAPDVTAVEVVPDGFSVTEDFDFQRVRVYRDANGWVAAVPERG